MLDAQQWRERLGEPSDQRTLPEIIAVLVTIIEHDVERLHTLQHESAFDTFLEETGHDITDALRELLPTLFPDTAEQTERIMGRRRDR